MSLILILSYRPKQETYTCFALFRNSKKVYISGTQCPIVMGLDENVAFGICKELIVKKEENGRHMTQFRVT